VVTASSISSGPHPKNVADHGSSSCFCSKSEPNQWVCFDFRARRVQPTAYAIRSANDMYPESWVIEACADGMVWNEIDRRDDNQDLSGKFLAKVFIVARAAEYRGIRLRQTGKNHEGNDQLVFNTFGVFGVLTK